MSSPLRASPVVNRFTDGYSWCHTALLMWLPRMPNLFSKQRIIARPGYNRWLVPPAAIAKALSASTVAWVAPKLPEGSLAETR